MEKPKARVDQTKCLSCGGCISVCPMDAIIMYANKSFVEEEKCTGCGLCAEICPVGAIRMAKMEVIVNQ
ncbi:MAG: ferredoxin [Thermoplasmata archaeon]|nr:MAG: ferredoxin [Thermoplasmata archaeon]RLF36663.1 MAG: ferredoxin [Thermoplasmata archaeon]